MNTRSKIRSALTKGDILLIALTVTVCLLWFVSSFAGDEESLSMEIYLDGQTEVVCSLSQMEEGQSFTVGGCEIYADRSGVRFVHSECEDGLCVKRGLMSRNGDSMACVPERVVVVLRGDEKADIVAY